VAETFAMFVLVSIVAGAIITTWAFVEGIRYLKPNAIRDAIIGLFLNAILISFS
jgi:hypothetical protein